MTTYNIPSTGPVDFATIANAIGYGLNQPISTKYTDVQLLAHEPAVLSFDAYHGKSMFRATGTAGFASLQTGYKPGVIGSLNDTAMNGLTLVGIFDDTNLGKAYVRFQSPDQAHIPGPIFFYAVAVYTNVTGTFKYLYAANAGITWYNSGGWFTDYVWPAYFGFVAGQPFQVSFFL